MLYPPLAENALRQFLIHELMADPWLSAIRGMNAISGKGLEGIDDWARQLSLLPFDRTLMGTLPITRSYVHTAAREILLSSAAFDSHLQFGEVRLDQTLLKAAERRLGAFVRTVGVPGLVFAYGLTASAENVLALRYYKRMREEDFLSGTLHRPWISRTLESELVLGLAVGIYALVLRDDCRWVSLTRRGVDILKETLAIWDRTGYTKARNRLLSVAQFNELADWDELSDGVTPDLRDARRNFLDGSHMKPGGRVLEIGSGTGLLTFDAGLARMVQPGIVTALDPSVAMTARARQKQAMHRITNVRFVQGMGEHMPFADNTFDAVISFGVLQYTERRQALQEIRRVLIPGGQFSIGIGLYQPVFDLPLVQKWFLPLGKNAHSRDTFCAPTEIPDLARDLGLLVDEVREHHATVDLTQPERVVKTFLQLPVYQQALFGVPYAARVALMDDLVGRGRYLLTRPHTQATAASPLQWIYGHKAV